MIRCSNTNMHTHVKVCYVDVVDVVVHDAHLNAKQSIQTG